MTNDDTRLLILAQRIWNEVESPSDEDMETVFMALIKHDEQRLIAFCDRDRKARFVSLVQELDGTKPTERDAEAILQDINNEREAISLEWLDEMDTDEWTRKAIREALAD